MDLLVFLCQFLPFFLMLDFSAASHHHHHHHHHHHASEGSCGKGCCPRKVVGGRSYTFKHESDNAKAHGCQDNCIYTEEGGSGQLTCFKKGLLPTTCINCKPLPEPPKKYCQSGQTCWPTKEEIEDIREEING